MSDKKMSKILVADDDPMVRNTATKILEMFGYTVETVSDGAGVIEVVDESFDVITAGWSVPGNWPVFKNKNQDIMQEANRILKKGDKLILYEGHYDISTLYLTKEEYDSILTKAGYKNIEIMDINGLYILVTGTK